MDMLSIQLPDDVISTLGKDKAQSLALEALLVKLYDLGELTSGRAAAILGVTRRNFLDLLGQYHVSIFDDTMDVEEDLRNIRRASNV